MKVRIGIRVRDNADGIADGNIVVDTFAIFELTSVSEDITAVLVLRDGVLVDAYAFIHRLAVADFAVELCHFDLIPPEPRIRADG
jgi:hypothetical protein